MLERSSLCRRSEDASANAQQDPFGRKYSSYACFFGTAPTEKCSSVTIDGLERSNSSIRSPGCLSAQHSEKIPSQQKLAVDHAVPFENAVRKQLETSNTKQTSLESMNATNSVQGNQQHIQSPAAEIQKRTKDHQEVLAHWARMVIHS